MGHSDQTWYVGSGGYKNNPCVPVITKCEYLITHLHICYKKANLKSTSWPAPKGGPRCIFCEYSERVRQEPQNSSLSYFHASYYDIGVPCKLLLPCQEDCASLLAVFFPLLYLWQGSKYAQNFKGHFGPLILKKLKTLKFFQDHGFSNIFYTSGIEINQHFQALSFENASCATNSTSQDRCAIVVHFVYNYNFTRFRCAESCTPQDHFKCLILCYRAHMPQKTRPALDLKGA